MYLCAFYIYRKCFAGDICVNKVSLAYTEPGLRQTAPLPQHFPRSLPPSSRLLSSALFISSPPPLNTHTALYFLLHEVSLSVCSFHNKRQGCRACKMTLSSNPWYSSLCCIPLIDREEKVQIPAWFKTAESERFTALHAIWGLNKSASLPGWSKLVPNEGIITFVSVSCYRDGIGTGKAFE